MHGHGGDGELALIMILGMPYGVALLLYLGAVAAEHRRGRSWPLPRTLAWTAGTLIAFAVAVLPVASGAHGDFVGHMTGHMLAGMLAPLLLVLARPVTLALRALDVVPARRLSRLLRSRVVRVVTHPVPAAALSVGTLALLYTTPLLDAMLGSALGHAALTAHFVAAGFLFTASIVGTDPSPHRAGFPLRAAVLVLAVAVHSVIAKAVYANPPAGVAPSEGEAAGLVMYYGGDALELLVIVVFCAQWYRDAGRRVGRERAAAVA